MISPIDTRILNARPSHLTAMTDQERAANMMLAGQRKLRLARLLSMLGRWAARRVSLRA